MFKLVRSLICLSLLSTSLVSFADAPATAEEHDLSAPPMEASLHGEDNDSAQRAIYWDFITCTYDNHDCLHEAEHHGYDHYRAVHDTVKCRGSRHYACYGGHH